MRSASRTPIASAEMGNPISPRRHVVLTSQGREAGLPLRTVRFEEFEAVAPGIFGEEPARSGKRVVVNGLHAVGDQKLAELTEITDGESRVRFFRGVKIGFDTDVDLLIAAFEPASAAAAQRSGLFDFTQAENRAVEFASRGFATLWSRQLNVVDTHDHGFFQTRLPQDRDSYSPCRPVHNELIVLQPASRAASRNLRCFGNFDIASFVAQAKPHVEPVKESSLSK